METLRNVIAEWLPIERVTVGDERIPHDRRAELARDDIDGLNALTQAASEWLLGRQVAALADTAMDAAAWLEELDALSRATLVRNTTYPREAVHVVDPHNAAFRSWRHVYVVGLAEGEFPIRADLNEHVVSDLERRALRLPTNEDRAARERHLFSSRGCHREGGTCVARPCVRPTGQGARAIALRERGATSIGRVSSSFSSRRGN